MFRKVLRFFFPVSGDWHWYGSKMRRQSEDGSVIYRDPTVQEIDERSAYEDRKAY